MGIYWDLTVYYGDLLGLLNHLMESNGLLIGIHVIGIWWKLERLGGDSNCVMYHSVIPEMAV